MRAFLAGVIAFLCVLERRCFCILSGASFAVMVFLSRWSNIHRHTMVRFRPFVFFSKNPLWCGFRGWHWCRFRCGLRRWFRCGLRRWFRCGLRRWFRCGNRSRRRYCFGGFFEKYFQILFAVFQRFLQGSATSGKQQHHGKQNTPYRSYILFHCFHPQKYIFLYYKSKFAIFCS